MGFRFTEIPDPLPFSDVKPESSLDRYLAKKAREESTCSPPSSPQSAFVTALIVVVMLLAVFGIGMGSYAFHLRQQKQMEIQRELTVSQILSSQAGRGTEGPKGQLGQPSRVQIESPGEVSLADVTSPRIAQRIGDSNDRPGQQAPEQIESPGKVSLADVALRQPDPRIGNPMERSRQQVPVQTESPGEVTTPDVAPHQSGPRTESPDDRSGKHAAVQADTPGRVVISEMASGQIGQRIRISNSQVKQQELASGGASAEPKQIWARSYLGQRAPEFHVQSWLTEVPRTEGKFVLIDFWATWCPPCREVTPKLNEFQKKFGDKLVVIGVSDEVEAKVAAYTQSFIHYYSAIDQSRTMYSQYEVRGIPHVVIIDPEGIVRWEGYPLEETELTEKEVAAILEG